MSALLVAMLFAGCSGPETRISLEWSPEGAGAYLDRRAGWWMGWESAARDHGSFCVSCHTALPYALARASLREALNEDGPSAGERRLLDNVIKRVRLWSEVGPYYADREDDAQKATESRGTESVLNALILADHDARERWFSEDARTALEHMWEQQQTTGDDAGAWPWLQFGLDPWEGKDSRYYGATLAALAAGTAPDTYRSNAAVVPRLNALRAYLKRDYLEQPLSNRVTLLWASTKLSGLLDTEREQSLVDEIFSEQLPDGGWSLASLHKPRTSLSSRVRSWIRNDGSDGYATGLVVYVLLEANMPREDVGLQRGLSWVIAHQNKAEGFWPASSLNKHRDPSTDVGRFMSDAATAYAVLAVTKANRQPSGSTQVR